MPGKIIVIMSCMFSGKTETLISYSRKYLVAKKKIVVVKYLADTRYSDTEVRSHNQNAIKANFSCNSLGIIVGNPNVREADVVLIDEGQFFPDLTIVAEQLAQNGKIVVVSCLSGNYKREPFPEVSALLSKAEEIIHLTAVCSRCGEPASFTKKIIPGSELILIGGSESYQARCRSCFELE